MFYIKLHRKKPALKLEVTKVINNGFDDRTIFWSVKTTEYGLLFNTVTKNNYVSDAEGIWPTRSCDTKNHMLPPIEHQQLLVNYLFNKQVQEEIKGDKPEYRIAEGKPELRIVK